MKMLLTLALILSTLQHVSSISPVIIIPGTGGSQLEAILTGKPSTPRFYCHSKTKSYFPLWLDVKSLLPLSIDCWVDNIRLDWDMKTMKVQNSPGVITRTPGFGDTSSIETLDYYGFVKYMKPLVDFLRKIGYKRGENLRGAPYDFRYSPESIPDNYYSKLTKLIESAYEKNKKQKVTLISHSYGCPVTLYFLSLQSDTWKEKYLKQWVALSGVYGGTVEEILLYSSGYLEGIPNVLVNKKKIRKEQRSSTSNLFMLPADSLWPKDAVVVKTKKRTYKLSEINTLLSDVGFNQGVVMRQHIMNSTHLMNTSPGVPIYCFHGNIPQSSVSQIIFEDDFPDSPSDIVKGSGDGTVNIESLELCKRFGSFQKQPVSSREIAGATHNGVLEHDTLFNTLQQIL